MAEEEQKNTPTSALHDKNNMQVSSDAVNEIKELDTDTLDDVSAGTRHPGDNRYSKDQGVYKESQAIL